MNTQKTKQPRQRPKPQPLLCTLVVPGPLWRVWLRTKRSWHPGTGELFQLTHNPNDLQRFLRGSLKQMFRPWLPISAEAAVTQSDKKAMTNTKQAAIRRDPKLANAWKTKSVEELTDAEVLAICLTTTT